MPYKSAQNLRRIYFLADAALLSNLKNKPFHLTTLFTERRFRFYYESNSGNYTQPNIYFTAANLVATLAVAEAQADSSVISNGTIQLGLTEYGTLDAVTNSGLVFLNETQEFITVSGRSANALIGIGDAIYEDPNPNVALSTATAGSTLNANVTDYGSYDLGTNFDLSFGTLAVTASAGILMEEHWRAGIEYVGSVVEDTSTSHQFNLRLSYEF